MSKMLNKTMIRSSRVGLTISTFKFFIPFVYQAKPSLTIVALKFWSLRRLSSGTQTQPGIEKIANNATIICFLKYRLKIILRFRKKVFFAITEQTKSF